MLITLRVNHSTRGWMSPELTPRLSASPEGLILCCRRRVVLKVSSLVAYIYVPRSPGTRMEIEPQGERRVVSEEEQRSASALKVSGLIMRHGLELQGTHHKLVSLPSD